jgi:hypothetical protein
LFIGFIVMLAMVTVYSGHKGGSSSASNDKPLKGTNSTRCGNMLAESSVNIHNSSCITYMLCSSPFCMFCETLLLPGAATVAANIGRQVTTFVNAVMCAGSPSQAQNRVKSKP